MAKLKFFYSSMGAGKSLDLLRINDNYRRLGKSCLLIKPDIDDRWGKDIIKSRIGVSEPCISFTKHENLMGLVKDNIGTSECILVDEAQFLSYLQVWDLIHVVEEYGIHVICFGLRTDFNGNNFEGSGALLGLADELKEIVTICHCGRKATMVLLRDPITGNIIKNRALDNVHIGDSEYYSVCRNHWMDNDIGIT